MKLDKIRELAQTDLYHEAIDRLKDRAKNLEGSQLYSELFEDQKLGMRVEDQLDNCSIPAYGFVDPQGHGYIITVASSYVNLSKNFK